MKIRQVILFFTAAAIILASCTALFINSNYHDYTKNQAKSLEKFKDKSALQNLKNQADAALKKRYKNITDKSIVAKSGKKNDYHSRAVYYWPKKSLSKSAVQDTSWEYVDGKINQESLKETDHNNYYEMLSAVKQLALAYHYFKDSVYAQKCAELINSWFIDDLTKMNPHFNYAQAIPGRYAGTPSGIIDSRGILWIIDAIELIKDSSMWTTSEDQKFREWLSELFDWLLFSDFGKRESMTKNNHGTFYDLQIIKIATFLNEISIAENYIDSVKIKRISNQIDSNGYQPEEMQRAKPQVYAVFNLSAFIEIAIIAELYDENIWDFKTTDSGSIKNAVDYLLSISDFKNDSEIKNLLRILPKANELSDGEYTEQIDKIKQNIKSFDLTELYFVN